MDHPLAMAGNPFKTYFLSYTGCDREQRLFILTSQTTANQVDEFDPDQASIFRVGGMPTDYYTEGTWMVLSLANITTRVFKEVSWVTTNNRGTKIQEFLRDHHEELNGSAPLRVRVNLETEILATDIGLHELLKRRDLVVTYIKQDMAHGMKSLLGKMPKDGYAICITSCRTKE